MAEKQSPLRIGIIGAGFSGTSLALNLHRLSQKPLEIFLFEKRKSFGTGVAYSSPFSFHLLNVRANDMSVFEDKPQHFINWLTLNQHLIANYLNNNLPIGEQFVPRLLYGQYLQDLLRRIQDDSSGNCKVTLVPSEVTDVVTVGQHAKLVLSDQSKMLADKVVFALGNSPPAPFPFFISSDVNCIHHPWDYHSPCQIGSKEVVLIIGTGLSMIDVVLTLYHQGHQGRIYALSRHGLLPLTHANQPVPTLFVKDELPHRPLSLLQYVRNHTQNHINTGGDWRSMMNAVRSKIPEIWTKASLQDKKQFIRHILPYWNIHRHRVQPHLTDLLNQLSARKQFHVLAGRILDVTQGKATIKLRHTNQLIRQNVNWLVNCMGPSYSQGALANAMLSRGIASLDPLRLGFAMTHAGALKESIDQTSTRFYTLGPPAKSAYWESSAVAEIRKQSLDLARHLLEIS